MPRGNSKKGTPARGQGVKRKIMAGPKEKGPISEINHRSFDEETEFFGTETAKYMRDIRFAAKKSHGWGTYDEQFRLRKAQRPQSSWAVINQDLWSFYITTAMIDQGQSNESKIGFSSQSEPLHSIRQLSGRQNVQPPRTCNAYNTKGKRCNFNPCRFKHGCSACGGQHPAYFCKRH
ncbi:unnamed protein product [Mytilus coruscus]|uniref:C3H1-type domain-containing protein n=1 Tax=Mytilus coruscus TaxID=42192 RepID=A0A6J8CSI3_MYTCO|nr:unnamed protein product [Mytilus coruscus]